MSNVPHTMRFDPTAGRSAPVDTMLDQLSVQATWDALHIEGKATEVRAIYTDGRVEVRNFGDFAAFHEVVSARNGQANLYAAMNVGPASDSEAQQGAFIPALRDQDVVQECTVVLDVDARARPKSQPATDGELMQTWEVGIRIKRFLAAKQVPSALAVSGNGTHLLIRTTPYPVTAEQRALRRALFRFLAKAFDTAECEVDQGLASMARHARVYGAVNVKGQPDEAAGRVWRQSIFVDPVPARCPLYELLAQEMQPYLAQPAGPPATAGEPPDPAAVLAELPALLARLDPGRADHYHDWLQVGMALHDATRGSDAGLTLWEGWSQQSQAYQQGCFKIRGGPFWGLPKAFLPAYFWTRGEGRRRGGG